MSSINELLEDLNKRILTSLPFRAVLYEQAHLQPKNEQTFPVVNKGNRKGIVISPNDNVPLQAYHRILESTTDTNPELGYGKKAYRKRIYSVRNVWIGSLKRLPIKSFETNDELKNEVFKAFPNVLTNNEVIIPISESVDKLDVLSEEFDGINMSSLSLDLVAFYINYEIHQRVDC